MSDVIYVLRDPETKDVKYVGRSQNPTERFRQHISSAHNPAVVNKGLANWICDLEKKQMRPIFEIIDVGSEYRCQKETMYIRHFGRLSELFNIHLTEFKHDDIDTSTMKHNAKMKGIKNQILADNLNVTKACISRYLNGHKNCLSLEKAKQLESYLM